MGEDPVSGTRTFDDAADRPFKVEFESFRPDMGRAVTIESGEPPLGDQTKPNTLCLLLFQVLAPG